MLTYEDDDKYKRRARRRGKVRLEQSFTDYLSFGYQSTCCMGMFLLIYTLALVFMIPMMQEPIITMGPESNETDHSVAMGPRAPRERLVQAASHLKEKFQQFRNERFNNTGDGSKGGRALERQVLGEAKDVFLSQLAKKRAERPPLVFEDASPKYDSDGFMVLGMHRSGTSMLSGLLVTGMGYNVGGPLIGAAFDNEKGFFELIDVVLQNDEFMNLQRVWWDNNVRAFDWERALRDKESKKARFKHGEKGLAFLNNPKNSPWLQKDPRMCICLRTWLKLLDKQPAVVFTYRHPLEVAKSLNKREENFGLDHGFRLWIIYNMKAIQNSEGLCRVLSSNEAVLENPLVEVQRISDELTNRCGVPAPLRKLQQSEVDKFIDPSLQHNKKERQKEEANQMRVLEEHDGGCVVRDYQSEHEAGSPEHQRELTLYKMAMRVYCDFKSGKAYQSAYVWPLLPA